MTDARTRLLDTLIAHAEADWVCPSLSKLAAMTGITLSTVSEYMRQLRKAGKITSRLVHVKPWGQARIVTITATGKSTKRPEPTTRHNAHPKPAFTPTVHGSPVRHLQGAEFKRRAAELLARDAEERRRMAPALYHEEGGR